MTYSRQRRFYNTKAIYWQKGRYYIQRILKNCGNNDKMMIMKTIMKQNLGDLLARKERSCLIPLNFDLLIFNNYVKQNTVLSKEENAPYQINDCNLVRRMVGQECNYWLLLYNINQHHKRHSVDRIGRFWM